MVVVSVLTLTASSAAAQTTGSAAYTLNLAGSRISFTIYGRAIFPIKREGHFNEFTGQLAFDPDHPGEMRVDLTVYTTSVDMNDSAQDQLLRSGNFFDVDHY